VLIPTAIAVLFAFILGPAVTVVRRILPLPLAVAAVRYRRALVVAGLVTMLIMRPARRGGRQPDWLPRQTFTENQDFRHLSEGDARSAVSSSMVASLARPRVDGRARGGSGGARVQSGSDFASVAAFVAPLMRPLLTIGIVVILVVFILLDRDHLSDPVRPAVWGDDVRDVGVPWRRGPSVGRVLSLQLLTNFASRSWSAVACSPSVCRTLSCGGC
jgi:predicted PurR-regulated permease PerM